MSVRPTDIDFREHLRRLNLIYPSGVNIDESISPTYTFKLDAGEIRFPRNIQSLLLIVMLAKQCSNATYSEHDEILNLVTEKIRDGVNNIWYDPKDFQAAKVWSPMYVPEKISLKNWILQNWPDAYRHFFVPSKK